jgi:hypothetical protein
MVVFWRGGGAEIHQALLLAEILIGRVIVKGRDSRDLKSANLDPGLAFWTLVDEFWGFS